jgi:hypothetical protein
MGSRTGLAKGHWVSLCEPPRGGHGFYRKNLRGHIASASGQFPPVGVASRLRARLRWRPRGDFRRIVQRFQRYTTVAITVSRRWQGRHGQAGQALARVPASVRRGVFFRGESRHAGACPCSRVRAIPARVRPGARVGAGMDRARAFPGKRRPAMQAMHTRYAIVTLVDLLRTCNYHHIERATSFGPTTVPGQAPIGLMVGHPLTER